MADKPQIAPEPNFTDLLKGIVTDAENLIRQQFELFRLEVKDEVERTKTAAISMAGGAGLISVAGIMSANMVAHWVHRSTKLPLWASYGIAGAVAGGVGLSLLNQARRETAGINLGLPPRTKKTLEENLSWLKEQTAASHP